MGKNGYFVFESKSDGLYINIIPPKEGGEAAAIEDIMFAMDKKGIVTSELITIRNAVLCNKNASIRIDDNKTYSTGEWMDIAFSGDKMIAVARFFPPFVGGKRLDYNDIISELKFKKVDYGIDEKTIKLFLEEREYGKKYVVAMGRKPIEGQDAKLEYLFDCSKKPMPRIKEDGSVDFYDLDNISHVKEGDVVARITKEIQGKPGFDVNGNVIQPRKVERKIFRFGRGLKVSDDGLELITEINGHVTLDGDRVSVSNTYEVVADVDFSTGNIDYDGNVVIKGNIMSGFSVRATGNIEVRGIVEGATIVAGGNVILGRGIQGMHQGIIKAGDSIVAKFFENAKSVEAENSIQVGAILHSTVTCGGDIVVEGKNGLIIGGKVVASKSITVKNLGNDMGTTTIASVGITPAIKLRAEELRKAIKDLNEDKEKISQVLTMLLKKNEATTLDNNKMELLKKTKESYDKISNDMKEAIEEYNAISAQLMENKSAFIKVTNRVFPGVTIVIGESEYHVKDREQFCIYRKDGADIVHSSL